MKRNCKTCTLNTTNDTVETCKRMCYLRYSKQRNKRICDLEQEIQKLKQTLTEIKDFLKEDCLIYKENYIKYQDILRKINEVE